MIFATLLSLYACQTSSFKVAQVSYELPNGVKVTDEFQGSGKLVEEGDKITIQYRVWDSLDRVLADSAKRGMPFTLVVGQRNSDPLVSVVLAGMHSGGVRTAWIPAELIPEGLGSIVPPKTDLHLWIFVLAAKAYISPKVDTTRAERIKGTVEVSRVAIHHGSTRTKDSL